MKREPIKLHPAYSLGSRLSALGARLHYSSEIKVAEQSHEGPATGSFVTLQLPREKIDLALKAVKKHASTYKLEKDLLPSSRSPWLFIKANSPRAKAHLLNALKEIPR